MGYGPNEQWTLDIQVYGFLCIVWKIAYNQLKMR